MEEFLACLGAGCCIGGCGGVLVYFGRKAYKKYPDQANKILGTTIDALAQVNADRRQTISQSYLTEE